MTPNPRTVVWRSGSIWGPHCALSYGEPDGPLKIVEIPQVVDAGQVRAEALLPSFLYLPVNTSSGPMHFIFPGLRVGNIPSVFAVLTERGTPSASRIRQELALP